MKLHYFLLIPIVVFFVACDKDKDMDPVDDLLTGKIRGVPFTYGSGRFVDFGPQSEEFNIRIDNESFVILDSCDTNSEDVYVRVDVLKEIGRKNLSKAIYVVFHHPDFSENLIVYGEGYYDVLSFNSNELEIEFNIGRDEDNYLEGKCTVYKCN